MCVSVAVSPCPGKCFAVVSTRAPGTECAPVMKAETKAETSAGFSPYERMLMIGLSGLLLTSASGKKSHCTPSARASFAVISPSMRASFGSRDAVKAIACGKTVVASMRIEAPRSKSAETTQRDRRQALHPVDETRGFERIGLGYGAAVRDVHQNQAAHMFLPDQVNELPVLARARVHRMSAEADHDQLRDLLPRRQRLHPACGDGLV